MNELNFAVMLNPHQLELYKAARAAYNQSQRDIDKTKQLQKDEVESLIETLGWDKKEHKNQIKALKKSLSLYAKSQAKTQQALINEAATLAGL